MYVIADAAEQLLAQRSACTSRSRFGLRRLRQWRENHMLGESISFVCNDDINDPMERLDDIVVRCQHYHRCRHMDDSDGCDCDDSSSSSDSSDEAHRPNVSSQLIKLDQFEVNHRNFSRQKLYKYITYEYTALTMMPEWCRWFCLCLILLRLVARLASRDVHISNAKA